MDNLGPSSRGTPGSSLLMRLFPLALVPILAMLGVLGWYVWNLYQHGKVVEGQQVKILELSASIVHLDEVLTMSARMAAATGDLQWENRYREFEPQLDAAIQELIGAGFEILENGSAVQTAAANTKLVAMENEAFDLVRQGDRQAAAALLYGQEYERQKRIYSDGMTESNNALRRHVKTVLVKHRRQMLVMVALGIIASLLMIFAWVGGLQALRHASRRSKMQERIQESEKKYRALITNIPDVTWTADCQGNTTFISPNVKNIYGFTPKEIYEQGPDLWLGRVHPDDVGQVKEALKILFEKGTRFDIEYRIKRKDGEWIWLHDRSIVSYEKDGVMYADGLFSDVTEHRQAEEELKRAAEEWTSTFNSITDLLSIHDKDFKFIRVNKAFADLFKMKTEEIIGKPCYELVHRTKEPPAACPHKQTLDTKKPNTQEFFEPELGLYLEVSASPLFDKKGQVAGCVHITKDITEHKRAQEELDRYREKMARAERLASLGMLSATLAHELSQPLTSIGLSIENSLARLKTAPSSRTVVEKLEEGLAKLSDVNSIVSKFRSSFRVTSDETVGRVDLNAVARRIVELLNQSALRAKVALEIKDLEKLPPIYSNEGDMEQLFFALTENAIQAADGKKDRRLVIGGTTKDEHIELRFSDNCGGIAPDNLDKIFEPFFTTGPTDERTGLGLCIVKRIVTRAGGRVRVESKAGKGSTFFMTLPISEGNET